MRSLTDTIVAPITAIGGAVAVLRVSGPQAEVVARAVFDNLPAEPAARQVFYGHFATGDDGFAVMFAAGHSYTGDLSAELSIHGSRASVQSLFEACLTAGARPAEPGEFTYRAFMNGRIDLTRAEGVNDTVRAESAAQLRQANWLREGHFQTGVREIAEVLTSVLVAVEAATDFSEEIGELDRPAATLRLQTAAKNLEKILQGATHAHRVREGLSLAIVGRPNVGKSSLFNAILRSERSIVTDLPGTTRDTVSEFVSIRGQMVRLVDTAGLRETVDVVEQLGVTRSHDAVRDADAVWYVYDQSEGWQDDDEIALETVNGDFVVVANKCDLPVGASQRSGAVRVSAQTGEGLELLLNSLELDGPAAAGLNRRHEPLLRAALGSLGDTIQTLTDPVPDDLASVHLRSALRCLGEITGETAPLDIVERVFHDFCIGK